MFEGPTSVRAGSRHSRNGLVTTAVQISAPHRLPRPRQALSLAPLDPETAIRAILKVDPKLRARPSTKTRKPKATPTSGGRARISGYDLPVLSVPSVRVTAIRTSSIAVSHRALTSRTRLKRGETALGETRLALHEPSLRPTQMGLASDTSPKYRSAVRPMSSRRMYQRPQPPSYPTTS